MQIVFRAKNLADAHSIRDVLTGAGIPVHVADPELWSVTGDLPGASVIRVLVDNLRVDAARRAIHAFQHQSRADQH